MEDDRTSVPDELFETLSRADAWPQWEEQAPEVRSMYIRWVAKPRRASERRSRADVTAYHAFHGTLDKAIQRPRVWKALLEFVGDAVS
ncbi:YdeI/OmpD-associated family protein [Pseudofrankia sp. BMG5.37]|uniref:YdeI/OmpD-associated family protein n=1 Tax=Pseudofrankia sp. BMG5.37 TaxID=3050035 RepID=UPI00289566F5|nr:YdeI/OmpD-associated family protein [Pseudofrankia sp. BMG5.37]MDT3444741.1 YdeI/OmpD-associated family protein [Pseudofrankia sp. BMG5.37]